MATRYVNAGSTPGGDGTTPALSGANRAYASMSEWEAARQGDLVTAAEGEIVICEGSTMDTTEVTMDGWIANNTYYPLIKSGTSDRASTEWDTGKYIIRGSGGNSGEPCA